MSFSENAISFFSSITDWFGKIFSLICLLFWLFCYARVYFLLQWLHFQALKRIFHIVCNPEVFNFSSEHKCFWDQGCTLEPWKLLGMLNKSGSYCASVEVKFNFLARGLQPNLQMNQLWLIVLSLLTWLELLGSNFFFSRSLQVDCVDFFLLQPAQLSVVFFLLNVFIRNVEIDLSFCFFNSWDKKKGGGFALDILLPL